MAASIPVTGEQKKSAASLAKIAKYNAQSTIGQLNQALADYDAADRQNASLAGTQFTQNSKQSAADRFSQAKKLQSSAKGILASAGNAMQGSQMGSLSGALAARQDLDTGEVLGTLGQNQQQVQNSLDESKNTNVLARRDAINNAVFGLRGISADTAAQLASIHGDLTKDPGSKDLDTGSAAVKARLKNIADNQATKVGYFMPDSMPPKSVAGQALSGNSYFDRLLNSYNKGRY